MSITTPPRCNHRGHHFPVRKVCAGCRNIRGIDEFAVLRPDPPTGWRTGDYHVPLCEYCQ